jgi:hypothetical protein
VEVVDLREDASGGAAIVREREIRKAAGRRAT